MAVTGSAERQGIQSIEVGFKLLNVMAAASHPMMLRDIAKGANMAAAKAHRYMVSFMRVGIVEQDSASGRYDLGPLALKLGLSSMGRLDPVRLAGPILDQLCEEIHETVALAVWGSHGATIVRIVDSGSPVTVTLRPGTVLPLQTSATGRAFSAFCRSPFVRQLLDEEMRKTSETQKVAMATLRRQQDKVLGEIRERGLARATGNLTPGINGLSVPVFDSIGQMVAAITSLGPVGEFNAEWDSPAAKAMQSAAKTLSNRLGYDKTRVGQPE